MTLCWPSTLYVYGGDGKNEKGCPSLVLIKWPRIALNMPIDMRAAPLVWAALLGGDPDEAERIMLALVPRTPTAGGGLWSHVIMAAESLVVAPNVRPLLRERPCTLAGEEVQSMVASLLAACIVVHRSGLVPSTVRARALMSRLIEDARALTQATIPRHFDQTAFFADDIGCQGLRALPVCMCAKRSGKCCAVDVMVSCSGDPIQRARYAHGCRSEAESRHRRDDALMSADIGGVARLCRALVIQCESANHSRAAQSATWRAWCGRVRALGVCVDQTLRTTFDRSCHGHDAHLATVARSAADVLRGACLLGPKSL